MANKANIFAVLPQDHSDDEDHQGNQQSRKNQKQTNKRDTGNRDERPSGNQAAAKTQDTKKAAGKDDHKKSKAVPEPGQHPLDRHSGTGQPAFDKKNFKKGGHGKGNVGNATKENEEETKEEATEEEQVQEEQKPDGITLEEWKAQQNLVAAQNQVDQAKLKSVQDELTKELLSKKATLYQRNKNVEEGPVSKKRQTTNVDHHAALNSEHSDLLQFRTGFVEFKEKKDREAKPAPKKEEKVEEAAPEAKEGEEKPATEEAEKTEDKEKRGKGGYKGNNNKGGNYKGKSGNRDNTNRGPKGGNQPKINFEDESAFPKLG